VAPLVGAIGIGSLFSPWIARWPIYGYQFFLHQKVVSQAGTFRMYQVDPHVFNEMRLQVILSCLFLLIAAAAVFLTYTSAGLRRFLQAFTLLIAIMAANIVTYLLLLYYQAPREIMPSLMGMLLGGGDFNSARGVPLLFQEPMYGFYIFLAANLTMATLIGLITTGSQAAGGTNAIGELRDVTAT